MAVSTVKPLQKWAWLASILAALIVAVTLLWTVMVYAGDNRYMKRIELPRVMAEFRLQQINDVINDLQIKNEYGEATKADRVRLASYIRKREELLKRN